MKVLWLCNIVLPDFSEEFAIKKNAFGGWMTGMLHGLEEMEEVEISLCFPIFDPDRKKDGKCNGHEYYTFLCKNLELYDNELVNVFEKILEISNPDIVHIWGTEYPHTMSMMLACKNKKILDRVVINIQGLVSICTKHYFSDIPNKYKTLKIEGGISIQDEQESFENRGKYEIQSLRMVKHVIGRTDWDRACVKAINPDIQYHYCDEILRNIFYKYIGEWKYENCQKHRIFISQASYPIKGFHYLLQALPIIIKQYQDVHVYVAGKDILDVKGKSVYGIYINNMIKELKLENHITFLGKLNEAQMIDQYLIANIYVLPSSIENSPNSLSEAMLIGTPSIATYVGGIYNRLTSNIDGILYPHNEPNLLAYYVCKLFENEDNICMKFSCNSVKKMSELINGESTVIRNLKIYRKILEASELANSWVDSKINGI